jgi:hypothetical protein
MQPSGKKSPRSVATILINRGAPVQQFSTVVLPNGQHAFQASIAPRCRGAVVPRIALASYDATKPTT